MESVESAASVSAQNHSADLAGGAVVERGMGGSAAAGRGAARRHDISRKTYNR